MPHLILVRHGESELNLANRERRIFNGQNDTPLTENGRGQAIEAGKHLASLEDIRIQKAISSTLSRAVHTARLALAQLPYQVELLPPSKDLQERSLGAFENRFADEVFAAFPQYRDDPALRHFTLHFTQKAPGGENMADVTERAWKATRRFEAQCEGDLAIFSHALTIRCLVGKALNLSQEEIIRMPVPENASPIILWRGKEYELLSGLTLHL